MPARPTRPTPIDCHAAPCRSARCTPAAARAHSAGTARAPRAAAPASSSPTLALSLAHRGPPAGLRGAALLLAMLAAPALALADGLRWPAPVSRWQPEAAERWSPWQGRIGLTLGDTAATPVTAPATGWDGSGPGLRLHGARLLGDYYFSPRSGFHATGGVISGPLASGWGALPASAGSGLSLTLSSPRWATGLGLDTATPTPRPYLGAGYSLGSADGRWSFSADIGVVGRPGDGGLGRWSVETGGWTSLGDRLGRWQVQPLVQLGVSYSF